MGYTITITNSSVSYVEPKVVDLETISPSLITEPNVPIEEYTSDVTNSDTFVYVPLYKRVQYVKLEAGTSLIIKTDNTDETMYYLNMNLDNVSVAVETGPSDAGLPEVNSDDNGKVLTVVDGVWNKAEPSGGSNEPFIITVSYNNAYVAYTVDKSEQEILNAAKNTPENIVIKFIDKDTQEITYIKKYTLEDYTTYMNIQTYFTTLANSVNFAIRSINIGSGHPIAFFTQTRYSIDNGVITPSYSQIPM